ALARGEGDFADILRRAERPMIIVGRAFAARPDGAALLALAREIAETYSVGGEGALEGWNGYNLLNRAASHVAALDLGFLPGEGGRDLEGILSGAEAGEIELVWLLGADEIDMARLGQAFVVYQGHHGDAGAHRA